MVYIIAEAGVDHEGSPERLWRLLTAAVSSGADCFKIQYYAKGFCGAHRELPWLKQSLIQALDEQCREEGIDFLITPHDLWAMNFIERLGHKTIKLGSCDRGLLKRAKEGNLSVIVSTGKPGNDDGCLDQESVVALTQALGSTDTILHCVSKYPHPPSEALLGRIPWLLDQEGLPRTGYSDHTKGWMVCAAAVGAGAAVLEKHLTLERDVPYRNDTFCSLLPDEWPHFVATMRTLSNARETV